jgi:hypothetical protein
MARSLKEPKGNCLPGCEASIKMKCDSCHSIAQCVPQTGICLVCSFGEADQSRIEPFVTHELACPNSGYSANA